MPAPTTITMKRTARNPPEFDPSLSVTIIQNQSLLQGNVMFVRLELSIEIRTQAAIKMLYLQAECGTYLQADHI